MTTNVASSAVETATQTAASTGGSIGLTVFKLAVIAAICGLVYTMLKKKGGSPGSSGTAVEVLRNLCNAVSEPAAPQKEEAFGNYILNVLDRDNERTVIELNDKHLTAGSGELEVARRCGKRPDDQAGDRAEELPVVQPRGEAYGHGRTPHRCLPRKKRKTLHARETRPRLRSGRR